MAIHFLIAPMDLLYDVRLDRMHARRRIIVLLNRQKRRASVVLQNVSSINTLMFWGNFLVYSHYG